MDPESQADDSKLPVPLSTTYPTFLPSMEPNSSLAQTEDRTENPITSQMQNPTKVPTSTKLKTFETEARCNYQVIAESSIELPYYYRIETMSENEDFLDNIESFLLFTIAETLMGCKGKENRRLWDADRHNEARVTAVQSSPRDAVSNDRKQCFY